MRTWSIFLAIFLACVIAPSGMAQTVEKVDFQRDIRPILSNQCFKCHGPAVQKGGVRLDSQESALKKKAIVPGKIDASKLVERILADDDERMPPKSVGERLKPAQIELLKKWIAQGRRVHAALGVRQAESPPVLGECRTRNGGTIRLTRSSGLACGRRDWRRRRRRIPRH